MHLNRCPVCKTKSSLLSVVQDEAQREFLLIVAKLDVLQSAALLNYLSLFASEKRDIANDKALRLAKEVMQLAPWTLLTSAMAETVESLRSKPDGLPLKKHSYLKKVLSSVEQRQVVQVVDVVREQQQPKSAIGQALLALQQSKRQSHRGNDHG